MAGDARATATSHSKLSRRLVPTHPSDDESFLIAIA